MTKTEEILNREDEQKNEQRLITKEAASVEYLSSEGEELDYEDDSASHVHLILAVRGSCNVTLGMHRQLLKTGEMTCFAPALANKIALYMAKNSEVFIFRIKRLNFCTHFSIESLYSSVPDLKKHFLGSPIAMTIHTRIAQMLQLLLITMRDKEQQQTLFDLKEQELLHYIKAYYSESELLAFFAPIANCDADFAQHIYTNIDNIKTVEDIARLTGYSASGIKKKYIKVFGMPFSMWLARERAHKIHQAITGSQKTFKEIAIEIGFSSSSHLDSFCKRHFGMSPGSLRRKAARENINMITVLKNEENELKKQE